MYIKYPHYIRRNIQLLSLSTLCLVSSFAIGIHTAGNVQPVRLIEAGGTALAGDIDGNGTVDIADAILVLEVAQGYVLSTSDQLLADPNADGALTVDDAIRILSILSLQ
ncbi:hypothetical protein HN801_01310 [Candidatus Peregrinibacteria bacterium]|nr:hypothetical protein [Candidatus Peregrinibacteria bacterium]